MDDLDEEQLELVRLWFAFDKGHEEYRSGSFGNASQDLRRKNKTKWEEAMAFARKIEKMIENE